MGNGYSDYNRGYDEGFVEANRARRDGIERAHELQRRVNELEAAIRENSVVLLAIASISKVETVTDLVQHVHDSLTDAL